MWIDAGRAKSSSCMRGAASGRIHGLRAISGAPCRALRHGLGRQPRLSRPPSLSARRATGFLRSIGNPIQSWDGRKDAGGGYDMRILNIDIIICDRCTRRIELGHTHAPPGGYGTLVLRALRAERVAQGVNLTERETEILALIARGMPNKAIARALVMAEATVKVHVKAILRKTRSKNRTAAVAQRHCLPAANTPIGDEPERITAAVEMTADLCAECVEGLRAFMRHGSEAKQVAA